MDARELRVKATRAYCQAKAEGKSNKDAMATAKKVAPISHSLCDLQWYGHEANPARVIDLGVDPAQRDQAVVALRGGAGWNGAHVGEMLSWGQISICLGMFNPSDPSTAGENECRRIFQRVTGLDSQGTRSGQGGRWLSDDPTLYPGNHKRVGVEDEKPRLVDRQALAAGADEYQSRVVALATGRKAAAKGTRNKPATPKPKA